MPKESFFSYARLDAEAPLDGLFVDRIEKVLEGQVRAVLGQRDFTVWRDRKSLLFGDNWKAEIEQALYRADLFFCLLSPGWLKSDWCRREFGMYRARHQGRPAFVIRFRVLDPNDPEISRHAQLLDDLKSGNHVDLQNPVLRDPAEVDRVLHRMATDVGAQMQQLAEVRRAVASSPTHPPDAPAVPPIPLDGNASVRRIVDGSLDMPSQDSDLVLLDIGFIERAATTVRANGRKARVVFGVTAASLTTKVSSGRITGVRADFGRGYAPPRVSVQVQPTAVRVLRHLDIRSCDGGTLSGNPLRDKGEAGGPIELFSVEDAETDLVVEGTVRLDITGLHVEEEEPGCADPSDQAARLTQLRKLAELVLKKHGSTYDLGSVRRGKD